MQQNSEDDVYKQISESVIQNTVLSMNPLVKNLKHEKHKHIGYSITVKTSSDVAEGGPHYDFRRVRLPHLTLQLTDLIK